MLNFVEVDILPVDYLAQSTQMSKSLCLRLEASLDFSGWIQKRLNYVRKHMFFSLHGKISLPLNLHCLHGLYN